MLNFEAQMSRSWSRRAFGAPTTATVALLASQFMLSIICLSQVAAGEQRPNEPHRGLLNNLQESPLSKHLGAKKLLLTGGRTHKQSTTESDQQEGANGASRLHQNGEQRFQYPHLHGHPHHHHHHHQQQQQQQQHPAASGSKFNEPTSADRGADGPHSQPQPRQPVDRKDDRRQSEDESDRSGERGRKQFEQQPVGIVPRSGRPPALGLPPAAPRAGSRPAAGGKPSAGERSPSGDIKNSNVDLIETKQSTHSEQHDVSFDHHNERGLAADEFGDDGPPQGPLRGPPLPPLPLLAPSSPPPRPYEEHVTDSRPPELAPNNYEPGDTTQQQQRGYPVALEAVAEQQQPQGTDKGPRHSSANIRVVFNNNPQFIIGSNTGSDPAELLAKSAVLPAVSLQRKTRQPSSSLTSDDFYYPDESSLAETKLRKPADRYAEHVPCNKQHASLPANLEHVDLGERRPLGADQKPAENPAAAQAGPPQQQYEQQEQQGPAVKEPPKATPSKLRPVGKAPPPVTEQHSDDRQPVDVPFEQLVKSGLRPPLRMIISMQNKYGDVMKVPLSLHGSRSKVPAAYAGQDAQTPVNFFEPLQQVEREPSGDENTPIGGDVFDPSIVKPFVRGPPKRKQQPYEQQPPAPQLPTPQPQVKPIQEQYEQPVESAPKTPATKQTRAMEPQKANHYEAGASSPTEPAKGATYEPAADRKPDCRHQQHAKPAAEEQPQQQQDPNEYQAQQQEQQIILPMSVVDPATGLVQMVMPKLAQLQNKTFAGMLEQFQAALQEQMANHWAGEQRKQLDQDEAVQRQQDEQEDLMVALMASNMTSPGARPSGDSSTGRGRQQQQQHEVSMTVIKPPKGMTVQEAILAHAREGGPAVAILHSAGGRSQNQAPKSSAAQDSAAKADAASSSNSGSEEGPARPRGVSVQLKPSGRATGSAQTFLSLFNGDTNNRRVRPTSPDQATPALVPVLVSSAGDEIDPDGFSSAASLLDSASGGRPPASRRFLARLRRSIANPESSSSSPGSYRSLEPADKLVNRGNGSRGNNSNGAPQTLAKINDRLKSIRSSISNSLARGGPDNSSALSSGGGKPIAMAEKSPERKVKPLASKGTGKARAGDHDFLASASQQDEVSSSEDLSNEDDDSDSDGDADEGRQSDEPSASASSQDNQAPDDADYGAGELSADDFDADSSAGADMDDEPYNQAASSDRISDTSSFEIPSIDINPAALQQRGCRTVLREVQEIPLDGLGAVRADGQPGSGYSSADMGAGDTYLAATTNAAPPAHQQLGGLRVKRSAPGGAVNSRKVSSIVMTKECHFPSAESADDDPADQKRQQQLQASKQRTPTGPADGVRRQQHQQQRQQLVAAVGPFVAYDIERRDTGPVASRLGPNDLQNGGLRLLQGGGQTQPPPQPMLLQPVSPAQPPTKQLYANLLKAQSFEPPPTAQQQHLQPHQQSQVLARRARQSADLSVAPMGANRTPIVADQAAAAMLTRRSAAVGGQLSDSHSANPTSARAKPQQADQYQGAASGRNEVIARKLYKPPSADDPYHTLSYSSQTGVDPDMDQDEDDSVVMGPDEDSAGDEAAAASSGSRASRPRSSRPSESLSASEIEALQDPNHDDTDPGGSGGPDEPTQLNRPIDDASDADETDGDLTDESRPIANQQRIPGRRQQRLQRPVERRSSFGQQQTSPVVAGGGGNAGKRGPILGRSFKFEREVSRPQLRSGSVTNSAHQRLAQSLRPGQQVAFESLNGRLQQQPAAAPAGAIKRPIARQILAERREDSLDDDEGEDGDEGDGDSPPAAASSSAGHRRAHADEENPDSDPEYNPRESHLPSRLRPKKVEKSFAYVHRDLPKKGSRNPDDFVVSYGRGNLQTEQEDYDSDRDPGPRRRHTASSLESAASRVRAAGAAAEPKQRAQPPLVAESIKQEQFAARRRPVASEQSATGSSQRLHRARESPSAPNPERDQSMGAEQAPPAPIDDSVSKKRLRPRLQRPILMTRWR